MSVLFRFFPHYLVCLFVVGIHRDSRREVAVKVIDKLRFPNKQESVLKNEVAILKVCIHSFVMKLDLIMFSFYSEI
jgi:hypothetical protein